MHIDLQTWAKSTPSEQEQELAELKKLLNKAKKLQGSSMTKAIIIRSIVVLAATVLAVFISAIRNDTKGWQENLKIGLYVGLSVSALLVLDKILEEIKDCLFPKRQAIDNLANEFYKLIGETYFIATFPDGTQSTFFRTITNKKNLDKDKKLIKDLREKAGASSVDMVPATVHTKESASKELLDEFLALLIERMEKEINERQAAETDNNDENTLLLGNSSIAG